MTIGWECDILVNISRHDNWFQITIRLCYHACLIVFVIVQTLWLHLANRFRAKTVTPLGKFFNWFTFLHVIALNLVIYLKTTLDEAKMSFEEHGSESSESGGSEETRMLSRASHYVRSGGGSL